MAIRIKRSAGNAAPGSLVSGQLAYVEGATNGGTLYIGEISGAVREVGGKKFVEKLNGIEAGAQVNTVTSVAGQVGAVVLDSGDITDFSTAVDARITSGAITGALGYIPEDAADKGIANGYAPLDANAKVSTTYLYDITSGQVTTALGYTPENAANKGVANGYASLDAAGKVPSTQLPSYVDDVKEYANLASFPVTGETDKIYIALATNKTYRWSGSTYVEISASPGSTDAVPEGSTNLYFTTSRARNAISVTQNLTYNSTTGVITGPDLTPYLTSETDPIFNASPAKNITSTNITNWNTAYSWGNHASAGYLTSIGSIDNHSDVSITSPASNQLLRYNSTSGQWENATVTTSFLQLTDTPAAYTGAGGYYLKVTAGGTGVEFSQDVDDGSF